MRVLVPATMKPPPTSAGAALEGVETPPRSMVPTGPPALCRPTEMRPRFLSSSHQKARRTPSPPSAADRPPPLPSGLFWSTELVLPPRLHSVMISKPAFRLGLILASPEKMKREDVLTLSRRAYVPLRSPSF